MHDHGFCCEKGKRGIYMCRLVFKQGLRKWNVCNCSHPSRIEPNSITCRGLCLAWRCISDTAIGGRSIILPVHQSRGVCAAHPSDHQTIKPTRTTSLSKRETQDYFSAWRVLWSSYFSLSNTRPIPRSSPSPAWTLAINKLRHGQPPGLASPFPTRMEKRTSRPRLSSTQNTYVIHQANRWWILLCWT